MGYLLPAEYESYGLPADTTDDWVTMASALMESYCRRVSLLATQYVERMRLTAESQSVRLSYMPLAIVSPNTSAIVGVQARYARPRRGELQDPMLAQVAYAFSLPGSWSALDPASIDVDENTGNLTFPINFLGLSYNEVEITYTAGLLAIPPALKVACAQIVKNAQATPALNVRSSKLDTMQTQYFSGSLIDPQVQALLRPYFAQRVGDAMAIMNAAAVRAADSLLRTVGGRQVLLRTPAPAVPNDDGEQLGLAAPLFQDAVLAPVVFRRVRPKPSSGLAGKSEQGALYELLASVTAINSLLSTTGYNAAETLFASAFGVLLPDTAVQSVLMRIESAAWSEVGGSPYLYRLLLRAPLALNT